MEPNLTERQTNRIAAQILADIQKNWWYHIDEALGAYHHVELNDQDYINISKELADLLHDTD